MTYNTPELLLVGAARNLVLDACGLAAASDFVPEQYASCRPDNPGPEDLAVDFLQF